MAAWFSGYTVNIGTELIPCYAAISNKCLIENFLAVCDSHNARAREAITCNNVRLRELLREKISLRFGFFSQTPSTQPIMSADELSTILEEVDEDRRGFKLIRFT